MSDHTACLGLHFCIAAGQSEEGLLQTHLKCCFWHVTVKACAQSDYWRDPAFEIFQSAPHCAVGTFFQLRRLAASSAELAPLAETAFDISVVPGLPEHVAV